MSALDTLIQQSGGGKGANAPTTIASLVAASGGQSAQTQKINALQVKSDAAAQNAAQANSVAGLIKATAAGMWSASGIPQMAVSGFDQAKTALTTASGVTGSSRTGGLQEGLDLASGVGQVAFSPIAPVVNIASQLITAAVNAAGSKLADFKPIADYGKAVANIPNYDPDTETATKLLKILNAGGNVAMALLGAKGGELRATAEVGTRTSESSLVHNSPSPSAPEVVSEAPRVAPAAPEATAKTPIAPEQAKTAPAHSPLVDTSSSHEVITKTPTLQAGEVSARATKAASDINDNIVSKGFESQSIDELAKYTPSTKAEQIARVTEIMKDPDTAIRIAKGDAPVPDGVHAPVVFNAVVRYAMEKDDVPLQLALAKSPLAEGSSVTGQLLKAEQYNPFDHSPVRAIREVQKVREETMRKKVPETAAKIRKRATQLARREEIKGMVSDFITSIQC